DTLLGQYFSAGSKRIGRGGAQNRYQMRGRDGLVDCDDAHGASREETSAAGLFVGRTPLEPSSPGKWQAANCPGATSASGGRWVAQIVRSGLTAGPIGQRVWNRQAGGGSTGLGT